MTEKSNEIFYLLICEIGPINEFTRQSRKTIDYWGSSFIFSYLMSEVAIRLNKKVGAKILLPHLENNPMFNRNGAPIHCGSVPDQLYILFDETMRIEVEESLKSVINKSVGNIASAIENKFSVKAENVSINRAEIERHFNLFYIVHKIKNAIPSYEEFIEAERRIKMRAALRPFEQNKDKEEIKKWEKCNICGERKCVLEIPIDKDAGLYNLERICSVCLLKRYLHETVDKLIGDQVVKPKYLSTSDIAAIPINNRMKDFQTTGADCIKEVNVLSNRLTAEYTATQNDSILQYHIDKGRSYFDVLLPSLKSFRNKFRECEKTFSLDKLQWLERPFYSIVYMDGDDLGKILKANRENFQGYLEETSKAISEFSNGVNDIIVGNHHGQLIFAGGEDVIFIIHPEYMLDCIDTIRKHYNNMFNKSIAKIPQANNFTISSGALVCYHKYPLSQAIMKAGEMIHEAKKHPGKNATTLLLIKGHTETLRLTIPNDQITNLLALKEHLLDSDISRTTPYRIEKSIDLLKAIADIKKRENYLKMILKGTRGEKHNNAKLDELTNNLMEFDSIDTMINALLYARFLAGDK